MSKSYLTNKKDFLGKPAPPGYIAGVGRGATGFTTRSDIGPARESSGAGPSSAAADKRLAAARQAEEDEEGEYLNDNNYDEFTGYGGSLFNKEDPYEEDDKEADKIYEEIDKHIDERGKALREKRQKLEIEKHRQERPKIQQQFKDLKQDLQSISEAEWMAIPEVGDARNRKQRVARPDKFTPLPDSLIAHQAKLAAGGETLVYIDPKKVPNPNDIPQDDEDEEDNKPLLSYKSNPDGSLVNIGDMNEYRSLCLSMKLSSASHAGAEPQVSADPEDYLTSMRSKVPSRIKDLSAMKEHRKQLASLRGSNPTYPMAWIASIQLEERIGDLKAARSLAREACENCPKSAEVWCESARLHPVDEAKCIIVRALTESPRSSVLWKKAIDLENSEEDKKRVIEKAKKLLPKSEWPPDPQ